MAQCVDKKDKRCVEVVEYIKRNGGDIDNLNSLTFYYKKFLEEKKNI